MSINKEILDEIAISKFEYGEIVNKLKREPSQLELGLFGAFGLNIVDTNIQKNY